MKNTIASFALALAMILPGVSFADVADPAPVSQADITVQIDALKQQLIVLLTAKLAELQAQLDAQLGQIHDIKSSMSDAPAVNTPVQNTQDIADARARVGESATWSTGVITNNGKDVVGNTSGGITSVHFSYLESIDTVSVKVYQGIRTLNGITPEYSKGDEVLPLDNAEPSCGAIHNSTLKSCGINYTFPYQAGKFLIVEATINGNTESKVVGDPSAL